MAASAKFLEILDGITDSLREHQWHNMSKILEITYKLRAHRCHNIS
jgi:hypothetical protein